MIRKRVADAQDCPQNDALYAENQRPSFRRTRLQWSRRAAIFVALAFAGLPMYKRRSSGKRAESLNTDFDYRQLDDCVVASTPIPDERNATSRPLFFPQYPDSIHDGLLKSIVQGLTGLSTGAKSYYAQTKELRRCVGPTPTVACLIIHPLVRLARSPDDPRFTRKFAPDVVYSLRSPTMSLALHQNWKDIKYRQRSGQTPEDSWRQFRDRHALGAFDDWRDQIQAWRNLTQYRIPLYLPMERLMDPRTGPELLERLAALFRQHGVATVRDADLACVWYRSIGRGRLERFRKFGYDFEDYTPGYTQPQLDNITQRLEEFMREVAGDAELVGILRDYRRSVSQDTKVDRPYEAPVPPEAST